MSRNQSRVPNGWQPCEICDLLIQEEDGLCVYCKREAQFLSNHHAPYIYGTTGALEEPVTVKIPRPKNHQGRRLFSGQRRFSVISLYTRLNWGATNKTYPESRIQQPWIKYSDPDKEEDAA